MAFQTCHDRQRLAARRPGDSQRARDASGVEWKIEATKITPTGESVGQWLEVKNQRKQRRLGDLVCLAIKIVHPARQIIAECRWSGERKISGLSPVECIL